jgi:hypothetical protein
MPIGDRIRRWRNRRLIRDGEEYTIDEEDRGEVELDLPERRPEPPVDIQGEPWGWTKPGDRPKGWPGPDQSRDDPGPYDGSWEPPEAGR